MITHYCKYDQRILPVRMKNKFYKKINSFFCTRRIKVNYYAYLVSLFRRFLDALSSSKIKHLKGKIGLKTAVNISYLNF